eukprot:8320911-Lingulodinium_polyedra.AAC.1
MSLAGGLPGGPAGRCCCQGNIVSGPRVRYSFRAPLHRYAAIPQSKLFFVWTTAFHVSALRVHLAPRRTEAEGRLQSVAARHRV